MWLFSKDGVEGGWKWGEHELLMVSSRDWDVHIKMVINSGSKSVISNRDINLTACRLLLLSVIRPSIENLGEIWEGNKGQIAALESNILGELK